MKSHQRGPLVFSGLVSFWGKNRKVRFGPDPAQARHDTPLIAARVPGLGATRPPHHGAWSIGAAGGTGKRRCFHIPGLLVISCARSVQQERQGRTSEANPDRPNERTPGSRAPPCRISTQTANAKRLSPEPREGSMREGLGQHHRRRIYHQHPMPYPHYRVEHQLWDKNSRSREARTEETAFSACETPNFFNADKITETTV